MKVLEVTEIDKIEEMKINNKYQEYKNILNTHEIFGEMKKAVDVGMKLFEIGFSDDEISEITGLNLDAISNIKVNI